jgi:hypothetical protein
MLPIGQQILHAALAQPGDLTGGITDYLEKT